ncbi:MAG: type II secretion system protein [Thermogemmata sp.]|nr:type II secretion system protein [Thermogemmata sp.]
MRRAGITLVEVLVAIMITGFGIISIIVLFPAGTIRLAEAFRQERASLAAYNADQFLRALWQSPELDNEPFFRALEDPDGSTGPLPRANPYEPSYPVVIDPLGIASDPRPIWSPPNSTHVLIRRYLSLQPSGNPSTISPLVLASSHDGVYWDTDQKSYTRDYRYNWLWIVQRPRNYHKYIAIMTIIVFDQRTEYITNYEIRCKCTGVTNDANNYVVSVDNDNLQDFRNGYLLEIVTDPANVRQYRVHKIAEMAKASGNATWIYLETSPILNPGQQGIAVLYRGVAGVYHRPPLIRGD